MNSIEKTLYDYEGNFNPLTDNYGNTFQELALLRNTFMTAEREYFMYLLSFPEVLRHFKKNLELDSYKLFSIALEIQSKLENGLLESPEEIELMKYMTPEEKDKKHMEKLELAEAQMCLYLAAARDKARVLELVKTYEINEEPFSMNR